jgi:hypothetical protein
MKHLLIFGAFVLSLGLQASAVSPLPAPTATPGYCGPAADTAAVQNLWLKAYGPKTPWAASSGPATPPLNVTYIMAIIVSGNYSQLMFQKAGQANSYYLKQGNAWHFVGYFPPKAWPKFVITKFNNVVNGWGNGGKPCANPRFVNHPSGP